MWRCPYDQGSSPVPQRLVVVPHGRRRAFGLTLQCRQMFIHHSVLTPRPRSSREGNSHRFFCTLVARCAQPLYPVCVIFTVVSVVIVRLAANDTACGTNGTEVPFLYILDWSVPHQHAHKLNYSPDVRILPIAFGFLLLMLALFKAREFWKLNGYSGSRLVVVLIKDQAFYYLLYASSFCCRWHYSL